MMKLFKLTFFVAVLGLCSCQSKTAEEPSNVLFVSIDDLNDWIGALGDPQAITPNLDKLFAEGMLFTNAHASQAVCTASRNSLLSGLHPTTTGWYGSTKSMAKNYVEVMEGNMMLPEYFKSHGYETLAGGKVFHNGETDYKDRLDDYWDVVSPHFWNGMPKAIKDNGYGYRGYMFYPFPKKGGQLVQAYGEERIIKDYKPVNRFYSLCGGPLDEEDIPPGGMFDEQIADWGIEQLQKPHEKPFFLAVGFVRPHVPYAVPREYFDLYDIDEIIMPEVPEDEMSDIPLYGKLIAYGYTPQGGWGDVQQEEHIHRELVHSYLASISFVDAQVGKLMEAFEKSEYVNNTTVVLWSDHGQHLGEKRHFRKQALWEESTHVPLFFKTPNMKKGQRCDEPVSLLDIYPTLLDLCNLPKNTMNDGCSLIPQLEDPAAVREHPVLSSWMYKNYAVRSKDWRYIQYRNGEEELYNHVVDPNEHTNLANDSEYRLIVEEYRKWIPKTCAEPAGSVNWNGDKYEALIKKWEEESMPIWLE